MATKRQKGKPAPKKAGPSKPSPPPPASYQPTDDEIEERVDFVYMLLSNRVRKGAVKRAFRDKYPGTQSARQIEGYITKAKALIAADVDIGRKAERNEAIAFYKAIIGNPTERTANRLAAQKDLRDLLALDIKPPPLKDIREALGLADDAAEGGPSGPLSGPGPGPAGGHPAPPAASKA